MGEVINLKELLQRETQRRSSLHQFVDFINVINITNLKIL
ncbi:MAG: type I secretion C-terminal target domain-containing protein [Anaerolineales bacterium]|nr:type I secretion C-terminal target domain-containing protein [Anaerolineales bacterium]